MPCMNHPEVEDGLERCVRCRKTFCADCLVEMKAGVFCASCKQEEVKDIQSGVAGTGELPLAGIGARFLAVTLDGLVMALVFIPLMFVFGFMMFSSLESGSPPDEMMGTQIALQLFFTAIGIVYNGAFLQWRGQTLGKMALGIKVVTPDGSDIAPGAAWIRPIVQTVLSPCAITYWPALFTKEKTGIHDMAAKTRVIKIR